ncbi:MAG: hypothetical protein GXO39_00940 [Thermotogae bacterium]|nr:hypothetical protein [Thermotogota bacterium]
MRRLVSLILLLTLGLISCKGEPKPVPIEFGKDACFWCKMTITDQRFGAELVTKKGKVYKYDDVACMVNHFWQDPNLTEKSVALFLVVDYAHPGKLIDATKAVYVQSDKIHSPMASDVAAFSTVEDAEAFIERNGGEVLNWPQVMDLVRKQNPMPMEGGHKHQMR